MEEETEDVPRHHVRQNICATRKRYRDGRRDTAVKVYTISQESRYLMMVGVPSLGVSEELVKMCALYGQIDEYQILDEYPQSDPHTEVYLIKFNKIQAARVAKRRLDDYSFFGGVLHVFYCPEYETVQETRQKLIGRRRWVASQIKRLNDEQSEKKTEIPEPNFIDVIEPVKSVSTNQRPSSSHVTSWTNHKTDNNPVPSTSSNHKMDNNPVPSTSSNHKMETSHVTASTNQIDYRRVAPPTNSNRTVNHDVNLSTRTNQKRFDTLTPPPNLNIQRNLMDFPSNQYMGSPRDSYVYHQNVAHNHQNRFTDKKSPEQNTNQRMKNPQKKIVTDSSDIQNGKESKEEGAQTNKYGDRNEKIIHGVKIKKFSPKSTPKFIPRQLRQNPEITKPKVRKSDDLDEIIRKNAYVLGPVEGPSERPSTVRERVTEEEMSIEKSRAAIREKLKMFCPTLLPRQLRKRKREETTEPT